MVILALLCCLLVPSNVYAAVEDYETALMNPEQLYQYEYEPNVMSNDEIRAGSVTDADRTILDCIGDVIIKVDHVGSTTSRGLWLVIREYVLMNVVPIAILLVFFWWGVRKAVKVLFAAFRKSRASV